MTTAAERKYINIRKRLDQLGYRQTLSVDSLPLVEKLFSDLVHTTESLRQCRLSSVKAEKESANFDFVLEPYKLENTRLNKENNELYLELMKLREYSDKHIKDLKTTLKKCTRETADLKFLNNQYVHKVRLLERESKAKDEKIQQLQEKNLRAVVQTPGGKKRNIAFRRQRMQIDEPAPPSEVNSYPVPQPEDPYIADLLQVADNRIQELQEEVHQLQEKLAQMEKGVQDYSRQIELREREIERLSLALDGGRSPDVLSLETRNKTNEKLIAHLNIQVDFLQQANKELEKHIQELMETKETVTTEVVNLSNRNEKLCQELTEIDQLAQQLERHKEQVLETADKELGEAKKEIKRNLCERRNLEEKMSKLQWELDISHKEKERLSSELLLKSDLEAVVHQLEQEKQRLNKKLQSFAVTERELTLEVERMRLEHGIKRRDKSPSRLDTFLKGIEEERDYYKKELEKLQHLIQRRSCSTNYCAREKSPIVKCSEKNYMDYLSRLYEREIKDFFEVAKMKMTGTSKESKKFATLPRKESAVKQETESLHGSSGKLTGSTSSLNKLSVQSSGSRRSQSSSLLDMGNMSASDLDVADRTKFDKIFEQVLSELEPLCLAEQDFISKFFKLQQHQNMSASVTEAEDLDGASLSRQHSSGTLLPVSSEKDMIRQMMIKIFRCIEPELNNLIALGDKVDSFNSLYMLVKMSHHVWTAQNVDPASFLSTTLGNVLVTVKRNFDKCISNQIRQMEEVKISKKSKVGILPFVAEFEEFAGLAESIFKNAERRGDLDKAYTKLIRGVFINVEKVANDSQKTPRDVVMMENFHHIFATLSRLKISCLEAEKKEAKQKYTDHLQSYVIYSLGQPLEKLNHFFEGVEARVAQGIREEEVSYQLAFNKQELRKVIKEYPGKEVKKGLDNLYKKVDKHLCEEENLLQVVWHSMQDEFIRQYKHFEGLIARCYPGSGVTMEFTIQDILDYCSSIAQSH